MPTRPILPLLLACLCLSAAPAGARCLRYEPATVKLEGTLVSRQLPGPPNYSNIARGDRPQTVLFLELDEPLCVSGDPSSSRNSKSHAGIEEVQIDYPLEKARLRLDETVRATGSLFGAHMGAHRTPVVLRVKTLRGL